LPPTPLNNIPQHWTLLGSPQRDEVEPHFQFGRDGFRRTKEMTRGVVMKLEMQRMGQDMLESMASSYPEEVWNACEVEHPDRLNEKDARERAMALAAVKEAKEKQRLAQALVRTGISSTEADGEQAGRALIPYKQEREDDEAAIMEERAMAKLARHTGWSILDVEEVHDIFHRYARNGSINTTCNEFKFLVLEICSDTTEAEMRAMFRDIRKVRRSSLQWHKRFSQVTNAYSNGNPSALKAYAGLSAFVSARTCHFPCVA